MEGSRTWLTFALLLTPVIAGLSFFPNMRVAQAFIALGAVAFCLYKYAKSSSGKSGSSETTGFVGVKRCPDTHWLSDEGECRWRTHVKLGEADEAGGDYTLNTDLDPEHEGLKHISGTFNGGKNSADLRLICDKFKGYPYVDLVRMNASCVR